MSWSERLRGASGARPGTTRTAVLSPAPAGWLGLEQVRGLRIVASRGVVRLEQADGTQRRVAESGAVTRLSLVTGSALATVTSHPAGEHGLLVLQDGERPLLALWVAQWVPGAGQALTASQARSMAGVDALARELSVPVEPADPEVLTRTAAAVRAVLVDPAPVHAPLVARVKRAAPVLLALWGLGFFAYGIAGSVVTNLGDGDRSLSMPAPFAWLGVLAAVALLAADAVASRRAGALVRSSPALADGAWVPRPAGPVPAGFLEQARLLPGQQQLVVRDADGREAWLPGPARGGVSAVAFTGDQVVLLDSSGSELLALHQSSWVGQPGAVEALSALLTGTGITVAHGLTAPLPLFALPLVLGPQTLPWLGERRESTGLASTNLRIAATAVAGMAGVFCLALGGALGNDAGRSGPALVDLALGGLGIAAALTQAALGVLRGLRDRSARRVVR